MLYQTKKLRSSYFVVFVLCFFVPLTNAEAGVIPVIVATPPNTQISINLERSITDISNPIVTVKIPPSNGAAVAAVNDQNSTTVIISTPNIDYVGRDTFEYEVINDAGQPESATVTIIIGTSAPGFPQEDVALSGFSGWNFPSYTLTRPIVVNLNNDQFVDIVGYVNGDIAESFVTFINDGNGAFATNNNTIANVFALKDMDGDTDLDVITRTLEIWTNNGEGIFTQSQTSQLNNLAQNLEVGDLDGDLDNDVIVFGLSGFEVWFNDGKGKLTSNLQFEEIPVKGASLGDLDCDGDLDLFSAGASTEVWINNGHGNFKKGSQVFDTPNNSNVELADMNGDGSLDAIITNSIDSRLWVNNGKGEFILDAHFSSNTNGIHYLQISDLNNDGRPDVVIEKLEQRSSDTLTLISVLLNVGNGRFIFTPHYQHARIKSSPELDLSHRMAIGDINGDQYNDVIVSEFYGSLILFNNFGKLFGIELATAPQDPKNYFQVSKQVQHVTEQSGKVSVSVKLSLPLATDLTVEYGTVADTATEDEDYIASTGTLFWPAGDNSEKTIYVDVLRDQIADSSESFWVFFNTVPQSYSNTLYSTVIIDDETPKLPISQCTTSPNPVVEGDGGGGSFNLTIIILLLLVVYYVASLRLRL